MTEYELKLWIDRFQEAIEWEDSIHEAINSTGDVARNFVKAWHDHG